MDMDVHAQMGMDMLGQLTDRREATADQALDQSLRMALSTVTLITQGFTMAVAELLSDGFHQVDFHPNCGKLHTTVLCSVVSSRRSAINKKHEQPSLLIK